MDQTGKDTVIRVTLRENVRFHNGDVLTSDDFRYAYDRQRDPISRNAGRFRYIRDLVVLDERRFDIVFHTPDGAFIPLNLALWAIPRRYYEEVGDAGVQAHPIGTGPWRFVSRKPREELVVERFEDYWNPKAQPAAKRLVIKIIPEDTTRVAAFKTGGVDWMDAVPPALIADFERLPGVRVVSLPAPNNLFLNINATDPRHPLADVRVRQAIAHGIDFDAIIEFILYGQGIRTAQLAPGSLGHDPDLAPYPYDPVACPGTAGRSRLQPRHQRQLLQPNHAARALHQGDGRGRVRLPRHRRHTLPPRTDGIRCLDQPGPGERPSPHGRHHEHDVGPGAAG